MSIDPQLIFQSPDTFKTYILSANPEGQFFDRKEIRNDSSKKIEEGREAVLQCISAFTNSRGGIIVVGISDSGTVIGLDHLDENEYNSVASVKDKLINHQSESKEWLLDGKKILLIYCPQGLYGICKTNAATSKGWIREGARSSPLTLSIEERLYTERNIKFEQLPACEYDSDLINVGVLEAFKKNYQVDRGSTYQYGDLDFLKSIGAIKPSNGVLVFTNVGFLFFAGNPRSQVPSSFVRMLKYECEYSNFANPGNAVFDRDFDGSLPELLQKIRAFVNEAPYFKRYSYRDPKGSGIIEEPEFPLAAAEEAIVNAVIHRDYNAANPITCTLYKDAFVVRSPGKLLQLAHIPTSFDLSHQVLEHHPRNPKIVEWTRIMRDENGQRFVKALSEGTRSMNDQMIALGLPAPQYNTNGYTTVVLSNNYQEREARFAQLSHVATGEFANLFPMTLSSRSTETLSSDFEQQNLKTTILKLFRDKLQNLGWYIDKDSASRLIAHQRGKHFPLDNLIERYFRVYEAYAFQVHSIGQKLYLSIDYDVQVKNIATIVQLQRIGFSDFNDRNALVKKGGQWVHGRIVDTSEYFARIELPEFETVEEFPITDVIPYVRRKEWGTVLQKAGVTFNFDAKIKELSLGSQINASKERAARILSMSRLLSVSIFPLSYAEMSVSISPNPVELIEADEQKKLPFTVSHAIHEPKVRFYDDSVDTNILNGLTRFGAFAHTPKDLEIVPLCSPGMEDGMRQLLDKIAKGSMNYQGMEKTFGVRPYYGAIISRNPAEYLEECERLLTVHPEWAGNVNLNRIFLVYVPEGTYPETDINSPYYTVKEYLFSKGIPVQMVDTPTLRDAKFKDLNLSLNIVAKTGRTPWVLPNALADADFFIGLSYTQRFENGALRRTMGYANVFNRYGQWQYYKGNSTAFDFNEKHIHLALLVKEALLSLNSLSETPSIHIHYSAKFSKVDREKIIAAAQEVRPKVKLTFIWINIGHNVRLFDSRPEGNGSLSRGAYVVTSNNQFYLSTTGYSPLRKTLGTPLMLEVNARLEPYNDDTGVPIKTLAQHLLSLTKLNWSSTQSINAEPVTIKYAKDIARLSSALIRRTGTFNLHKILEQTPWFL